MWQLLLPPTTLRYCHSACGHLQLPSAPAPHEAAATSPSNTHSMSGQKLLPQVTGIFKLLAPPPPPSPTILDNRAFTLYTKTQHVCVSTLYTCVYTCTHMHHMYSFCLIHTHRSKIISSIKRSFTASYDCSGGLFSAIRCELEVKMSVLASIRDMYLVYFL